MELAAYIYDALAYEQAQNDQLDTDLIGFNLPIELSPRKWQACLLSAIAATSFTGLSFNFDKSAQAAIALEPSVNVAPWCNNLYLCDTNYVLEVQSLLTQQGFSVGQIDGVYGTHTKQAVIEFQKLQNNLVVDGIPGERTLSLLRQTPRQTENTQASRIFTRSSSEPQNNTTYQIYPRKNARLLINQTGNSEEIGNLQILLKQRGFYQGEVDGRVDTETTQAIQKAQQAYGLNVDGFAGPWTIRALLAGGNDQVLTQPSLDLEPSAKEVKDIQTLLQERGFYEGELNGIYDIYTRASIVKAQIAYGQAVTGEPNPDLILRMKSQDRNRNNVQNIQNSPSSQDIRPSPRNVLPNSQAYAPR
ncbi:peptidoglycan-binding protein [Pseudanabaena sp. FACHB-1998]|uniref:peptidoglycan-binding domain-containing protein n=1 Tax=Pseudanabaena sp. FACHB-1998 TaxID=2692858 RepID=UPI001680B486|nr:peptidoglycan-binding protein [Pseudanabaena sp. FACHB-1998]MBD2176740.1 peptidoglycan-binding protein [Pseudanabaena sp. FACHB-1998]